MYFQLKVLQIWGHQRGVLTSEPLALAPSEWQHQREVLTSGPRSVRVVALSGCVPDTGRKPPCVLCESGLMRHVNLRSRVRFIIEQIDICSMMKRTISRVLHWAHGTNCGTLFLVTSAVTTMTITTLPSRRNKTVLSLSVRFTANYSTVARASAVDRTVWLPYYFSLLCVGWVIELSVSEQCARPVSYRSSRL
jgi:hypothetical protein